MSVQVSELLSNIQRLLIETVDGGATWASGLWDPDEVLTYVNEAQVSTICLTACVLARDNSTMGVTPQVELVALPDDLIEPYAVAFVAANGTSYCLMRVDQQRADYQSVSWATTAANPLPWGYSFDNRPHGQLSLVPPSNIPGTLDMLYVQRPTRVTDPATAVVVPDELAPAIQWEVTAVMLEHLVGGAESPERAQYARLRAGEYKAAFQILLQGWA